MRAGLQRWEAQAQKRPAARSSSCQCGRVGSSVLRLRIRARQVSLGRKRAGVHEHLLLLLLDSVLNRRSLLPKLVRANLVILHRLANACELLIELCLEFGLFLFPGELFRSSALSLVEALSVGRDDPLILLVDSGPAALETLAPLDSRVEFRLQRRDFSGNGSTCGNKFFLGGVQEFQFTFIVCLLGVPFLDLLLRNLLDAIKLNFEYCGSFFGLSDVPFQL